MSWVARLASLVACLAMLASGATSVRLGTFGFDGEVPAGATIDTVIVSVEWKVDTTASNATLGSQVYVNGVARGN
jgi:hypothetical protein